MEMALNFDTHNDSVNYSQTPGLATSLTSFGDVEGQSSDSISSLEGDYEEEPKMIVAKSVAFGNYTRRMSQEDKICHRRRSVETTTPHSRQNFVQNADRRYSCQDYYPSHERSSPPSSGPKFSPNQLHTTIDFREDLFPSAISSEKKSAKIGSILKQLSSIAIALGVVALIAFQHHKIHKLQQEVSTHIESRGALQQSHRSLLSDLQHVNKSLQSMKKSHEKLNEANDNMNSHIEGLKQEVVAGNTERGKSLEKLAIAEREAETMKGKFEKLVDSIQSNSRARVLEKFGPGPYKVEISVQFPTSPSIRTITVELASLEDMPHSVHTFLEQVDQNAWDGKYFSLHVGHVLMAQTNAPNQRRVTRSFNDVPTVLFPEYSNNFPHDKYTLAFPGRPGSGQDFYINLQNNTPHHSPRVSKDGSFVEGEPCFGRIVDANSRKVVDDMDALSMGKGGYLKDPVLIKSARVL